MSDGKRVTIKLADYKPHPKNPNTHPEAQVGELVKSLDMFGQYKNIVVWRGHYIAGHGLALAAESQGRDTLDAMDVSEWDEEKALALMVADNRLPELALMDTTVLTEAIAAIGDNIEIPGDIDGWMESADDLGIHQVSIDDRSTIPMVWVLAGIPIERYHEFASTVEAMAKVEGAVVETATGAAEEG